MAHKIQIKRGNKADLPVLNDGEMGLCIDTQEVFVGSNGTNIPVGVQTEIVNNLTETVTGKALDATQGKVLNDLVSTHTADLITDSNGAHGLKIESGTFTPIFYGNATPGSNTYAKQIGNYTKIGSMVFFQLDLELSLKDAAMAGEVVIAGMPFSSSGNFGVPIGLYLYFTQTAQYGFTAYTSFTNIQVRPIVEDSQISPLQPTNITNTSRITIAGCYKAA